MSALAVTNACKSNATGTYSDLSLSIAGNAAPDPAVVGTDTITLSGVTFQASVPATLLVAGYNLGLLVVGSNNIPVKGWVSIQATNTVEGSRVATFTVSVTTTISDPNGIPGTGDETATPLGVSVPLADSTWTPTGGDVQFRQGGSIPTIPAGQVAPGATTPAGSIFINAQVANGLIKANFDCKPGAASADGATFTPGSAGAFESVVITGAQPATTIPGTTVPGATTTTAAGATTSTTAAATTTTTAAATTTTAAATTTTGPPPPITGHADYVTTCTNSVTPDPSELGFSASGIVPSKVTAGAPFTVTNQAWKVTVPGGVFDAGINFGLLAPGQVITGTLDVAIEGANTVEGRQDATGIQVSIPVQLTSEGKGADATVEFIIPDLKWTALTGNIPFRFYGANVSVNIGLPNPVAFVCKPVNTNPYLQTTGEGATALTAAPTTSVASAGPTSAPTGVAAASGGQIPTTGSNDNLLVQIAVGLLLLDIGYLVMSLRRKPPAKLRR